jgi:RNA recognition motif-containing protein
MSAKIFVGNLNPRTTRSQLAQFFAAVGRVESIRIPLDRNTGKPRGFCFVEFADADTAQKAITLHDRSELDGQQLRLSWAREREENGAGRAGPTLRPAPDALPRNETKDYRETLERHPRFSVAGSDRNAPGRSDDPDTPEEALAQRCVAL